MLMVAPNATAPVKPLDATALDTLTLQSTTCLIGP